MNEEGLENEAALVDQLNAEQEVYQKQERINKLTEEAQNLGHPSHLKYAFLFLVAGIVDMVDLADVTGIGILISKVVSIGGTGLIYFTLWLTDGKMKRAQIIGEDAAQAVLALQQSISQASRTAMRTAKTLGHVPGLKGLARQIPRTTVNIRKIARRNPLTKILVGGAINLIPWVAIVNLMVVWVYLSYRDEKKTLKESREAAGEALP